MPLRVRPRPGQLGVASGASVRPASGLRGAGLSRAVLVQIPAPRARGVRGLPGPRLPDADLRHLQPGHAAAHPLAAHVRGAAHRRHGGVLHHVPGTGLLARPAREGLCWEAELRPRLSPESAVQSCRAVLCASSRPRRFHAAARCPCVRTRTGAGSLQDAGRGVLCRPSQYRSSQYRRRPACPRPPAARPLPAVSLRPCPRWPPPRDVRQPGPLRQVRRAECFRGCPAVADTSPVLTFQLRVVGVFPAESPRRRCEPCPSVVCAFSSGSGLKSCSERRPPLRNCVSKNTPRRTRFLSPAKAERLGSAFVLGTNHVLPHCVTRP